MMVRPEPSAAVPGAQRRLTVAIAQPTFLPWAGWFDLADAADELVILDDVAFSKQTWQQRNRIRVSDGLAYVTVPVKTAGRLGQKIIDTEFSDDGFVRKILARIHDSYAKAPFFAAQFEEFRSVFTAGAASGRLAELNCALIGWLAARLGVTTPMVRSSALGVEGKRGAYVARLCAHFGATHYLSPAGAEDYLLEDRAEFDTRGIVVELQVYEHPVYRQRFEPFVPYASALDLLMNEGPAAGGIMRSGRRAARALGFQAASEE